MTALEFFLSQHTRLHSAKVGQVEGGSFADRVFGGLTDEQMRLRPARGVNSLAWLLWHLARAEDAVVNVVVGAREQVLSSEDWPRRLGVSRRDIGTAMTETEVGELGARLDVAAARAYRDAVGRRTQEVVRGLAPARWSEVLSAVDTDRAVAGGAFGPGAEWVPKMYQDRTRGGMLGANAIAHNAMHLGEAISVRGLAGLGLGL
jgi:DinB superfamily